MRNIFALLLAVTLIAAFSTAANAQQTLKCEAYNFTLKFDFDTELIIDTAFADDGTTLREVNYQCIGHGKADGKMLTHMEFTSYWPITPTQYMKDSANLLSVTAENFLKQVKDKKISSKDISLRGFPGIETQSVPEEEILANTLNTTRFYLVATQIYCISISIDIRDKTFNDARVQAFLNSFDLISPEKAQQQKSRLNMMINRRTQRPR